MTAELPPITQMGSPIIVPTREGYDRWAEFYDVDDNPLVKLEEPVVRRLHGDPRGLDVLDVGCGTGRWAHQLADAGASVTAFDFSLGMLRKAREKSTRHPIRFLVHDVAHDLPFADNSFDRVNCCLVIDHVADLERLFREMGRVCRSSGRIIASTLHPAMMLKGTQARFRDPTTGQETRPRSEPHHISDYVMAIIRSGLGLARMEEHVADEALTARSPRAVKYLGWPMLLVFELQP
ncbi:MAG: class I SAM-dependent methyltransferase [Phycisphaerae bacterium]|nr:class I SAM-dependent methyltransferase [Phycisphaerae bacterium]